MSERCHYCGSWAIGSSCRVGELECRDCGVEGPANLFTGSRRNGEKPDKISFTYCGLAVACRYGPPNPMDPFVRGVAKEMAALGRRWRAGDLPKNSEAPGPAEAVPGA